MANTKAFKVKNGLEIAAFVAAKSLTANRVFVYDTSKDSDGGMWRKRTSHTSWYNEPLNTTYRGSRREFPAVAVIVIENNYLWIYDGDDPTLPMWMGFYHPDSGTTLLGRGNVNLTGVYALNGILGVTSSDGGTTYGTFTLTKFISDDGYIIFYDTYRWVAGIAERNTSSSVSQFFSDDGIVNDFATAVVMQVRENCVIDEDTGLPNPYMAVNTLGGTTIITDKGRLINKSGGAYYGLDTLGEDAFNTMGSGDAMSVIAWDDTDSAINYQKGVRRYNGNTATGYYPYLTANGGQVTGMGPYAFCYTGSNTGATLYSETPYSNLGRTSMQAQIKAAYTTGWMPGDIKLATLADIDDTDAVGGTNMITNGDFSSGTTGWTASRGATLSVVSGELVVTPDGTTYGAGGGQAVTTVAGRTYMVTATCVVEGNTAQMRACTSNDVTSGFVTVSFDGNGSTKTMTFTAVGTTTWIIMEENNNQVANASTFDNVSMYLAEDDRSWNNNGLQVYGTVSKNPVATGAELVGYSNWNASNYLYQEYNSLLAVGAGDFAVMYWVQVRSAGDTNHFTIAPDLTTANPTNGMYVWSYGGYLKVNLGGSVFTEQNADSPIPSSSTAPWSFVVLARQAGQCYYYLNGVQQLSLVTNTGSITGTSNKLWIGKGYYSGYSQSMSLFRFTRTVPSPDQIAKIYQHEKELFMDNAACTLYGTAESPSRPAFDPVTKELHVGTGDGTSRIKGLRRVDSNTTATDAWLSASNGLVVSE